MLVKIILSVLGIANGAFMLLDGIHVMRKGKYMGPAKPGPWANIFYKLNINVFKLGPLFVILGLGWFLWIYGLWSPQEGTFIMGILIATLTLWYIKVGTFISILTLVLLFFFRAQLGL